jgi:hypothetical protein
MRQLASAATERAELDPKDWSQLDAQKWTPTQAQVFDKLKRTGGESYVGYILDGSLPRAQDINRELIRRGLPYRLFFNKERTLCSILKVIAK